MKLIFEVKFFHTTDINQYLELECIINSESFFNQWFLVYILPEERRGKSLLKEEGKQLKAVLFPIPTSVPL